MMLTSTNNLNGFEIHRSNRRWQFGEHVFRYHVARS